MSSAAQPIRDPRTGHLLPGTVLNPKGRGKKLGGMTLTQACRQLTPDAIRALKHWVNQTKYPAVAVKAAEVILDRGHGKAVQPIADGTEHPALSLDLTDMDSNDLKRLEISLKRLLALEVTEVIDPSDLIETGQESRDSSPSRVHLDESGQGDS